MENPRTTKEDARHGVQSLELDSHHLRGSRCSNWAPRTLGLGYLKFHHNSPADTSARGIELRLLLEIIANPLGINQPTLLFEILVLSLFSSCPGDGGNVALAGIITSDGHVAAQCNDRHVTRTLGLGWAECFVRSVAALGLRIFLRYALSDPFPGSACCGPAGGTTANFILLRFIKGFSARISEGLETPQTGPYVSNCIFG